MSAKGFVERNAHLLLKFAAVREVHDQEASDQRCWTNEGSFFFFFKSKFGRFFIELFSFQDIQDGNGGIFDNHDEFIYF